MVDKMHTEGVLGKSLRSKILQCFLLLPFPLTRSSLESLCGDRDPVWLSHRASAHCINKRSSAGWAQGSEPVTQTLCCSISAGGRWPGHWPEQALSPHILPLLVMTTAMVFLSAVR